mmetsp:Transcript_1131/g.3179  ORF Transcript_1131/g.3179 Transcript_1131/m.3179 type:complete len:847 (+) Transcript_1131:750-3290(+)
MNLVSHILLAAIAAGYVSGQCPDNSANVVSVSLSRDGAIVPLTSGAPAAATTVTIAGTDLAVGVFPNISSTAVTIGTAACTLVSVTTTDITCTLPVSANVVCQDRVATMLVTPSNGTGTPCTSPSRVDSVPIACDNPVATVTNAAPSLATVPVYGGYGFLTLTGTNFPVADNSSVVAQVAVNVPGIGACSDVFVQSNTSIICSLPGPAPAGGLYDIAVSINNFTVTGTPKIAYGEPNATISSIAPAAGGSVPVPVNSTCAACVTGAAGGPVVEIMGSSFGALNKEQIVVTVGGAACVVTAVANDKITCTAPQFQNASAQTVSVTVNGDPATARDGTTSGLKLYYGPPTVVPTLTRAETGVTIFNATGQLTFVGTSFTKPYNVSDTAVNAGQLVVTIGNTTCAVSGVPTETQFLCSLSGGLAAGVHAVSATMNGVGLGGTPFDIAVGNPSAVVASITPSVGVLGLNEVNNTAVTLSGTGLTGNAPQIVVKIGNDTITPTAYTRSTIVFNAPSKNESQAIPVDVVINGYSAVSVSLIYGQFYSPVVVAAKPELNVAVNTQPNITISGSGFGNNPGQVMVTVGGGNNTCSVKTATSTAATCMCPALPEGRYTVVVSVNGKSSNDTVELVYGTPLSPVVTSATPSLAPMGTVGGQIVIAGSNFGTNPGQVSVTIGNGTCVVVSATPTSVTCSAPGNAEGTYAVVLAVNGRVATSTVNLVYGSPLVPVVSSASTNTSIVPAAAGQGATLTADNFGNNPGQLQILINNQSATITGWSGKTITFIVPSTAAGSYPVVLAVNGKTGSTVNLIVGDASATISGVVSIPANIPQDNYGLFYLKTTSLPCLRALKSV